MSDWVEVSGKIVLTDKGLSVKFPEPKKLTPEELGQGDAKKTCKEWGCPEVHTCEDCGWVEDETGTIPDEKLCMWVMFAVDGEWWRNHLDKIGQGFDERIKAKCGDGQDFVAQSADRLVASLADLTAAFNAVKDWVVPSDEAGVINVVRVARDVALEALAGAIEKRAWLAAGPHTDGADPIQSDYSVDDSTGPHTDEAD